jgi:microcystin-dependent protein
VTDLQVWVRDGSYQLIDRLDEWQSLTLIRRWNATGSWTLELAASSRFVQYFAPSSGIVVKVNGTTIFSGSASVSLAKTVETVTIVGEDDNALLEEPARPTPAQAAGPYPDAYDVRTGQASAIMSAYVSANIGPAAPVGTRIIQLVLAGDPLLGPTLTGRANLQSLRALLAGLADAGGGLGFEILQSDIAAGQVRFRIYAPTDRTADAKFSTDLGTAQDYSDVREYAGANYWVVMGGDGFGTNRTTVEDGNAAAIATIGRRITGVYDARGITSPSELNQKLAELLVGSTPTRKTSVTPFEVSGNEYFVYWGMGDLVTVVVDGESRTGVIREIRFDLTSDEGIRITPTIGDAGSGNDDASTRQARAVNERLSNLERNYTVPPASIDRSMLTAVNQPVIGAVVGFAGSAAPAGWLLCQGQLISRTTYAALFAVIGTTYGVGDGTTTFGLPDARGRVILGVSGGHALASTGGSETAAGLAHTHPGSHSHGHAHTHSHAHTGAAHTHPGSHSHGAGTLAIAHDHDVDINHTHGAFTSGGENTFAATFSTYPAATTNVSHNHQVTITALGTNTKTTGAAAHVSRSGSTDADTGAPAASYTGSSGTDASAASTGTTDPDSNAPAASYGGTIATLPPYLALNALIYTGV